MKQFPMSIDEARRIVAEYEACERATTPGSGFTAFHCFAKNFGYTLVADAVSRVVRAKRVIEQHEQRKQSR
jgi:hypothetical protein